MSKTLTATFGVVQAPHAPKFYALCPACRQVHAEGEWAVFITIKGQHFFVGQHPKPMCCNEELRVPFFFDDKDKALEMRDEVMDQVRQDGGKLISYNFFAAASFVPEKVH